MKKVNVVVLKWGTLYSASDVNKLYASIKRNTSYDIDFYCFTENADGLNENIIIKPLIQLNVSPEDNQKEYRKEAALCDDNLAGLINERVFFFDLDSLIVGNLDELFDYPQDDKFYIIRDWASYRKKGKSIGQASCYSWVVGTLGYIKTYFEAHAREVINTYGTASQEFLSAKVVERLGSLNFWPDNWFKSFRFHCMPHPLLRWFCTPKLPNVPGLKMICFHGLPNMQEAIDGVWSADPHHVKAPHGYKKIYKHVKPTRWILDYWKE